MNKMALCLFGRFDNRYSENAGFHGFSYIKESLLDKFDLDVFIFSNDTKNHQKIQDLYGEHACQISLEQPVDWNSRIDQANVPLIEYKPKQGDRTFSKSLNFFHSRSRSIQMAVNYAHSFSSEYKWLIAARFDLGQIDKHNGYQKFRVSEINFNPLLDNDKIYTALWDQTNAGIADQWVYGNQKTMSSLIGMEQNALTYLSKGSNYLQWLEGGVSFSNSEDPFSNEVLKQPSERSSSLMKVSRKEAIDNQLMHKFFFIEKDLLQKNSLVANVPGIARVLYTHTDYSDCWSIYFGQIAKYSNIFEKNYVFVNALDSRIPSFFEQIVYDDRESYTNRLLACLQKISASHIFFEHEDMVILRSPEVSQLNVFAGMLKRKPLDNFRRNKFDVIRLVNGGKYFSTKVKGEDGKFLRRISRLSSWIVSVQPSLWSRSSLILLLSLHQNKSIWEFETEAQRSMRKFRFRSALLVERTAKRGTAHFDSNVYPYLATAIVKGKWNLLEYGNELKKIAEEYGVDLKIRGSNITRTN